MALGPLDAGSVRLAVCRGDQLWLMVVDVKTGAIRHELSVGGAIGGAACRPARAASLVVMTDRLLLATAQELLVQTTTGSERRIPISRNPAARPEIHRTGEQWVEVESAGSMPLMVYFSSQPHLMHCFCSPVRIMEFQIGRQCANPSTALRQSERPQLLGLRRDPYVGSLGAFRLRRPRSAPASV